MARTGSAILLLCIAVSSGAQQLTCPNSPASGCAGFHYHVQAWSPEFRSSTELFGLETFASAETCYESRRLRWAANTEALQFLAAEARRMKTEPNVFGECHCDMTRDPTNPNYLDDPMRQYQVRTDMEYRNHLLAALLDRGLSSDSDLARSLGNSPSKFHGAALGRRRMIPAEGPDRLLRPEDSVLLDPVIPTAPGEGDWYRDLQLAAVALEPPEARRTAETRQHVFIRAETSRIQEIALEASWSGDPPSRIFRACAERMQLLSKLSRMMQSGQPDSLLAQEGQKAVYDDESMNRFVTRLFGRTAASHWSPSDPTDMSFDLPPAIGTNPAAVLQDADERYSPEERKLALYGFLVKNPLSPGEETWLRALAESWLDEE